MAAVRGLSVCTSVLQGTATAYRTAYGLFTGPGSRMRDGVCACGVARASVHFKGDVLAKPGLELGRRHRIAAVLHNDGPTAERRCCLRDCDRRLGEPLRDALHRSPQAPRHSNRPIRVRRIGEGRAAADKQSDNKGPESHLVMTFRGSNLCAVERRSRRRGLLSQSPSIDRLMAGGHQPYRSFLWCQLLMRARARKDKTSSFSFHAALPHLSSVRPAAGKFG